MIGFLSGTVRISNEQALLVEVNGVGYKVYAPLPLLVSLEKGDAVELYIHTHVREDALSLFGFKTELELFLFEKLISISGIGPKSALAMLSVHSPASIADAVEREDAAALSHTPGVGKKTAEKIILELRGKLAHLKTTTETDATYEVRLALETLGYSPKEIHDTLQKIHPGTKSTSTLIKEALAELQ